MKGKTNTAKKGTAKRTRKAAKATFKDFTDLTVLSGF
jgi:hypothetical protein